MTTWWQLANVTCDSGIRWIASIGRSRKKQYHGAYTSEAWQVMSGTMKTGESLAKIPVPALILKADASPEQRKTHEELAKVMQKGKLVHIDGAGHNLDHDELERTVEVLKEFLSTLRQ